MTTRGYLIKEGYDNLKKHTSKTLSTMLIITATMLILGIFVLILQNITANVRIIEEEQGFQAFITDGTTENQISYMEDEIKVLEGVEEVLYISKEMAFEHAKTVFEGQEYLLEGMEKTLPFPASFVVTFEDLEYASSVKEKVEKIEGIYKVSFNETTINSVLSISSVVSVVLLALGIVMLVVSVFIISNTIKLAVYSNKREIYIMKYIGATDSFIRAPFIVEGAIMGLVSSLISFIIVSLGYVAMYARVNSYGTSLGTFGLLPYSSLWYQVLGLFVILGLLIGIIGSMISLKKYLKN